MYICPTCEKEFLTEPEVVKHFLKCWKEKNPHHKSKDAPRSADIITTHTNLDVTEFFTQFN